jgi:hypothetical protein
MVKLDNYIDFVRNRSYMSGVDRNDMRVKKTAEWFTPTKLVIDMIKKIESFYPDFFVDKSKTVIDKSCGDGQFLSEVVIKKIERSGCSLEQALKTTYGVDLMEDNVIECRKRLAGPNPTPEILEIVTKNIVCHDSLTYDYKFE